MRFSNYLIEKDFGERGKVFDDIFVKACELVGLYLERNRYAGRIWDIKTKGDKWTRFFTNKEVY